MRIYGRKRNSDGTLSWVTIDTQQGATDDQVYVLWLIQSLKLNTLESPYWPSSGVPMWQAMQNTFYPDSSIADIQAAFSQYFTYLSITRTSAPDPTYSVLVVTKSGLKSNITVVT